LEAKERGEVQTAYQVLASSTAAKLARAEADLWDSGKVESAAALQVAYAGKPLRSGQRVWWKVRVWDSAGKPSRFSAPASFEMGLMRPGDWKAHWIQRRSSGPVPEAQAFDDHPAPLLRKGFSVEKEVIRARAYASGLGYYELRLNGERVGDHVLDPGWTTYSKRVLYSVYDITKQVKRGKNAVGVMLGNGWFNPLPLALWGSIKPGKALTTGEPRAIVQLVIEYADGTADTLGTDETWRAIGGPILRNSVYLGELYDARREQPGWDNGGFNDSGWEQTVLATEPELGPLRAQDAPPIRITRALRATKLTEPKPGVFIFDFGQNFAGWARLKVKGPAGTRVRLRSGELLYPDGTLNGMTAVAGQIKGGGKDYIYDGVGQPKTAFQLDEYVLKGQGTETYTPRFTFHGFRYVEVTGFPGQPTLESLEGLLLNSDVESVGFFECSNEMFNRIQQMVLWTELSNLFSVQSDCPHREKFGYGGDIAASSEMGMLNFDMSGFYRKASQDLIDAVRPNGAFTETAPFVGIADQSLGDGPTTVNLGPGAGPVDWSLAQPLLLVQLRQYYGEDRLIEEQYEATKRWIALLRANDIKGIFDHGISDHESLVPKPRALTGTAAYYYNLKLFAQVARVFGKSADADDAEAAAEKIKAAFNRKFLKDGTGRYDTGDQVCQAIALHHGLVPEDQRARVLEVLVNDIEARDNHLTTGIFGTKYMLNALTDAGRADVAYRLVNQRTFPGWGHMLENGATTLWEHWEFSDNTYSHNHPMFGSVSEWFYKALAGIQAAPDAVGFDKIIIRPRPVGELKWVKASYDSVRGKIVSQWEQGKEGFRLSVRIPVGATAMVYVPARTAAQVTEKGKQVSSARGVKFVRLEGEAAVFSVASGDYQFASSGE
jgi:alpha-L-rhamnosidase